MSTDGLERMEKRSANMREKTGNHIKLVSDAVLEAVELKDRYILDVLVLI